MRLPLTLEPWQNVHRIPAAIAALMRLLFVQACHLCDCRKENRDKETRRRVNEKNVANKYVSASLRHTILHPIKYPHELHSIQCNIVYFWKSESSATFNDTSIVVVVQCQQCMHSSRADVGNIQDAYHE